MVGGVSRRDGGSLVMSNTNVFAALETLQKKKKSDKERKSKGSSKSQPQPPMFWAPTPLNAKSWADIDDDDDDYFSITEPPPSAWAVSQSQPMQSQEKISHVEDSETEEDFLDECDGDDVEEEHERELEILLHPEPEAKKPVETVASPKETERQLSKKERKKKELAELEALLADFGVSQESSGQDESSVLVTGVPTEKKDTELDGEKKENVTAESKNSKKKKKKDKASKEAKELQDQQNVRSTNDGPGEVIVSDQTEEEASAIDVKERLKKVASMKKKKSSKEIDAAARTAAQEAAARSARLAVAKKKEKNHYNQQPVR